MTILREAPSPKRRWVTPMEAVIRFLLANFTLTFLVLGLAAAGVSLLRFPRPWTRAAVLEELFAWFLLFSIGCSFFYNFVAHAFFGAAVARIIGWDDSPFQTEVGVASLGYSLIGFLAFRGGLGSPGSSGPGPRLLPAGGVAGTCPADDRGARFRAGKCWHGFLHRHCRAADRHRAVGVPIPLATWRGTTRAAKPRWGPSPRRGWPDIARR